MQGPTSGGFLVLTDEVFQRVQAAGKSHHFLSTLKEGGRSGGTHTYRNQSADG